MQITSLQIWSQMGNVEHQLRCEVFIFIEVISFQASVNYLSTFYSHLLKKYPIHTEYIYIYIYMSKYMGV